MALPINITDLVHGNTIEWERLEFKQGWNPEDVIHSMCAFANDIHNWGGGYIILGIAEDNGRPVLPPVGLHQNQLDEIQGEIISLANKLQPTYFPITQPYTFQNKHILVLWCPAGDNRPYAAPKSFKNGTQRQSYVRIGSRSIIARGESLRKLQELTARIPFDDRINNQATINELDLGLIREYLQEIKSHLFEVSTKLSFVDLCKSMLIAKGPNEDIRPVNVGLLFFSKQPHRFFDRAWIELVLHKDSSGKNFIEKYFKGPLHKQLRDALSFIKTNIISESVKKIADKAESVRFFNYPFEAIEEVLSNAIYHKSYELGSPIEIQVFADKITFLSHPGPMPPVNAKILSTQKQIIAREYRNRRIGDFLKELHLTEGRGTGFPAIYNAMANNGSPDPAFETDETHYVLVTLPLNDDFRDLESNHISHKPGNQANKITIHNLHDLIAACNHASNQASNQVSNQVKDIVERHIGKYVRAILSELSAQSYSGTEILSKIGLTKQTKNKKAHIDPLLINGLIEYTIPDNPKDRNQKYKITKAGERLLKLLGE